MGVRIEAISLRGLIYGIHTLIAITKITSEREFEIPYCYIEDWPDFTMRGMQDDLARGQVGTISSYKRLIRELSRLKYNVLTFHTDDMFRFERYPDIGKQSGALTKSEWSQLVEYGHIYGLDLFLTFQTFSEKLLRPFLKIVILLDFQEDALLLSSNLNFHKMLFFRKDRQK